MVISVPFFKLNTVIGIIINCRKHSVQSLDHIEPAFAMPTSLALSMSTGKNSASLDETSTLIGVQLQFSS